MKKSVKKIVFFFEKKQVIGGGLIFFLALAGRIAQDREYDVHYVNYHNEKLEKEYRDTAVRYHDLEKCDFSQFEGADFVVPFNYLFLFLLRVKKIHFGRILLFDWHPELGNYLYNQIPFWQNNFQLMLSLFNSTDALAFMDKSCLLSVNRLSTETFKPLFVPVFCSGKTSKYKALPLRANEKISIGWMGRLDSDKIFSLTNLLDQLMLDDAISRVDLHIVGDGVARNKLSLQEYAPKVRFIFTSYLFGEERDHYFQENVDLAVAMGISALDISCLGIPTVIPIVSTRPFNNNQFVFLFDTKAYSLGWTKVDLLEMDCKAYSISQAIQMVYEPGGKTSLGEKCYQYCMDNFNLENSASSLLSAIDHSKLTLEKCRLHPVIKSQLNFFEVYKILRKNRTYSDFILFVQKVNQMRKGGLGQKTIITLKIILGFVIKRFETLLNKIKKYAKKVANYIKLRNNYYNVQKKYKVKIKYLKNNIKKGHPIKSAFLVMFSSVFSCQPIFEEMLKDPNFDPYIIIIPDMQRSLKQKIAAYRQAVTELSEHYPGRVLESFDDLSDTYLELKEEYPLVFFNNPYSQMAHPYHHVTYFLDKNVLPIYVNYGFAAVKYGRNIMKTDFYNLLWKVCLDSQINFEDVKKHQPIKGKNALVTGYVKMDRLSLAPIYQKERKKIIICPHHTVLGWKALDISNFLTYSELFVKLPTLYPEIDFVFRPHPLLFSNLVENRIWSQQEINNYLSRMTQSPNIRYDNSGDYFELFANSDAMIHDCSSFIGEYLFTEKPCCYMLKSPNQIEDVFLPMGVNCMKHYYKAYSNEDIIYFIDDVVVKGNDPLKVGREEFSRKELKFNYPHSSQMVLDMIKNTLEISRGN